jgi:hypothetical protein
MNNPFCTQQSIGVIVDSLQSLKLSLYRGPVRTAAQYLGLNQVGRRILGEYFEKIGGSVRVEIGPVAGTFDITTWEEYCAVNNAVEYERPIIAGTCLPPERFRHSLVTGT